MATFINEPSHTCNEYLLIPGYSSSECVPANVSLKTPLVRFKKNSAQAPSFLSAGGRARFAFSPRNGRKCRLPPVFELVAAGVHRTPAFRWVRAPLPYT